MVEQPRLCRICNWKFATRLDRCMTCYRYWRRNGRERPEELIVAQARRIEDRRFAQPRWR
jgi:hypothetical protein